MRQNTLFVSQNRNDSTSQPSQYVTTTNHIGTVSNSNDVVTPRNNTVNITFNSISSRSAKPVVPDMTDNSTFDTNDTSRNASDYIDKSFLKYEKYETSESLSTLQKQLVSDI